MASVGRRATLLLSLPTPTESSGEKVPLYITNPIDVHDRTLNNYISLWWRDRAHLCETVRQVQTKTLVLSTDQSGAHAAAVELHSDLSGLLRVVNLQMRQWGNLYGELVKRGSSWRARHAFVPQWLLLAPTVEFLVYDYGQRPTVVCGGVVHTSPSLVFESVMLSYLRAAVLQQMATMIALAVRHSPQSNLPSDAEVIELVRAARDDVKEIVEKHLPLHRALLDGTETFLLSTHFYQHLLARLLYSQHCYMLALEAYANSQLSETFDANGMLYSSALFATSARTLGATQRTTYVKTSLVGALACYRQASALLTLAQTLHTADVHMSLLDVVEYANAPPTVGLPDHRAFAVEAFYAVRAALVLAPDVEAARRAYERISARLHTMYGTALPAEPSPTVPASVGSEVRRCGGTRNANWEREFGRVVIEVCFQSAQSRMRALHRAPITEVVSVGLEKRHFVIECVDGVK